MLRVERSMIEAIQHHTGQVRKGSGIPYVVHAIEVLKCVADLGVNDPDVLSAAALHDTVEDTDLSLSEIEEQFGETVRDLVDALTHDESITKEAYLDSFASADVRALLVKLCDRYCNVMDYRRGVDPDYAPEYAAKARSIYEAVRARQAEIEEHFGELVKQRALVMADDLLELRARQTITSQKSRPDRRQIRHRAIERIRRRMLHTLRISRLSADRR